MEFVKTSNRTYIRDKQTIRDVSADLGMASQSIIMVLRGMIDQDYLNLNDVDMAIKNLENVKKLVENINIWAEIRNDYVDEDGNISIDAWLTDNDDETGLAIATVYQDGTIEYEDERAKTDEYAQEMINEALRVMEDKKEKEDDNNGT